MTPENLPSNVCPATGSAPAFLRTHAVPLLVSQNSQDLTTQNGLPAQTGQCRYGRYGIRASQGTEFTLLDNPGDLYQNQSAPSLKVERVVFGWLCAIKSGAFKSVKRGVF